MSKFSKAAQDAAYRTAEDAIEEARSTGAEKLDLWGDKFVALSHLPPQISELTSLQTLDFTQTDISDLAPLAALNGVQYLSLASTGVRDISPLADLTSLLSLRLDHTNVSDLSALASLTNLADLWLIGTDVSDLSPLATLTKLHGLALSETAISDLSPLAALIGLQTLWLKGTSVSDFSALGSLTGLRTLVLNQTIVGDLTPLATLSGLEWLSLEQTNITDLSPLAALSGLQTLSLNRTGVTKLAPLSTLTSLANLWIERTGVSDLSPLSTLTGLESLTLHGCPVSDLRPLIPLTKLGTNSAPGLVYSNTPATRSDATLLELSRIKDARERAEKTLAYLATLPPWPQPLAPEAPATEDLIIPPSRPAPLQVVEVDGVLHSMRTGDGLPPADTGLARQAWAALVDYLADLSDARARIVNALPQLGRALSRFETSIGATYDGMNPIALGVHGGRIIRLAPEATEALMPADAADMAEFAAALALFLERFPEWRAYRDAAVSAPDPDAIAASLPVALAFAEELTDRPEIAPEVPQELVALVDEARDAPNESVAARGLIDSLTNVISAFATRVFVWVKAETGDLGKLSWTEAKKMAAKAIVTGGTTLTGAALDIVFNKAGLLRALANRFPETFDWLTKFLSILGL